MSVTIQQLIFYRAVARNRSFSNAAKELYTSQPYVSNQIRKLEDHYGVALFLRSHPRITLTEAGEILYRRVDSLLDDLDDLEQVIQQFQGLRRGTVQFAAAASVGNHVMPEHIAGFHRDHPDIVVQGRIGSTEQVLEWLELDEIELGVSPRKPETGNLSAEPFYREPIVVLYPAAMQLPDPLPVETLATLPKVVREDGSRTLAKMYELLQDYPGGMDFIAQLEGTTAVNEAVAAGLGVSLVPERSAKAWLAAGVVGKCSLAGVELHHDLYLLFSEQRYVSPAARAFVEHLRRSGPA